MISSLSGKHFKRRGEKGKIFEKRRNGRNDLCWAQKSGSLLTSMELGTIYTPAPLSAWVPRSYASTDLLHVPAHGLLGSDGDVELAGSAPLPGQRVPHVHRDCDQRTIA